MTTQPDVSLKAMIAPVTRALAAMGDGAHAPKAVITAAIRDLKLPDNLTKKAETAAYNSAWELRQRGLILNEGRTWRLTEAGAQFARGEIELPARASQTVSVFGPRTGADGGAAPSTGSEAPGAGKPAPARKRLKLASSEDVVVPVATWAGDPYLRALVAKNHPCFGSFSPSHEACGECPLAASCRNAQASALALLAAHLRDAELPLAAAPAALHAAVAAAVNPKTARAEGALHAGRALITPYDGLDAVTGAPIPAGTPAYYVPDVGVVLDPASVPAAPSA